MSHGDGLAGLHLMHKLGHCVRKKEGLEARDGETNKTYNSRTNKHVTEDK